MWGAVFALVKVVELGIERMTGGGVFHNQKQILRVVHSVLVWSRQRGMVGA